MQHSKSLTILFALLLGSAYGAGIALPSNARELAAPNSELDDAVVTRGLGGKSLAGKSLSLSLINRYLDLLTKPGKKSMWTCWLKEVVTGMRSLTKPQLSLLVSEYICSVRSRALFLQGMQHNAHSLGFQPRNQDISDV